MFKIGQRVKVTDKSSKFCNEIMTIKNIIIGEPLENLYHLVTSSGVSVSFLESGLRALRLRKKQEPPIATIDKEIEWMNKVQSNFKSTIDNPMLANSTGLVPTYNALTMTIGNLE